MISLILTNKTPQEVVDKSKACFDSAQVARSELESGTWQTEEDAEEAETAATVERTIGRKRALPTSSSSDSGTAEGGEKGEEEVDGGVPESSSSSSNVVSSSSSSACASSTNGVDIKTSRAERAAKRAIENAEKAEIRAVSRRAVAHKKRLAEKRKQLDPLYWFEGKPLRSRASLVVVPASLLLQWGRELETKAPGLKVVMFFGQKRSEVQVNTSI